MSGEKLIINELDVTFELVPQLVAPFVNAIQSFEELHGHCEVKPKLRERAVNANSTDLVAILGYVDPEFLSQLDKKRLVQTIERALERELLRSTDLKRRAHYQWCLTAVKNLELGRYLID